MGAYDWGRDGPAPWNELAAWISPKGEVHDVGYTKSGSRRTHLGWIRANLSKTGVRAPTGKLGPREHTAIAKRMIHAGWIRKADRSSYEYHERHEGTHRRRVLNHIRDNHPEVSRVWLEITGGPSGFAAGG